MGFPIVLDLHLGGPVTGTHRFSRPGLERRLMRDLEHSAGVTMFGLRRIGKSSLKLYVMEKLKQARRPYLLVDAQGAQTLGDFLRRLWRAGSGESGLLGRAASSLESERSRAVLAAVVEGQDYEPDLLSAEWPAIAQAVALVLGRRGPKPLLIVEEFPSLIESMVKEGSPESVRDLDRLLIAMREWRGEGMTMLLIGSSGLSGMVRSCGIDLNHLNDLKRFVIPELTRTEAQSMIREATEEKANGRWTGAHTEALLQEVGVYYPYFLVAGLIEVDVEVPADLARYPADLRRPGAAEHPRQLLPPARSPFFRERAAHERGMAGASPAGAEGGPGKTGALQGGRHRLSRSLHAGRPGNRTGDPGRRRLHPVQRDSGGRAHLAAGQQRREPLVAPRPGRVSGVSVRFVVYSRYNFSRFNVILRQ